MKKIILLATLLAAFTGSFGQSCSVASASSATINSTTSVTISITQNMTNVVAIQVYYVRTGQTDTASTVPSLSTAVTLNSLVPNTPYTYQIRTFCSSGGFQNKAYSTFATSLPPKVYTPMNADGYSFKRASFDSVMHVPFTSPGLYRGILRPGAIVVDTADRLFKGWNGLTWEVMGANVGPLIDSIRKKVDSVTVSNDTLYYWIGGVSYGKVLSSLSIGLQQVTDVNNATNDNIFINSLYLKDATDAYGRILTYDQEYYLYNSAGSRIYIKNWANNLNLSLTNLSAERAQLFPDRDGVYALGVMVNGVEYDADNSGIIDIGSIGGGGIHKAYAAWGLINVDDSTLRVDTSNVSSIGYTLDLYNQLNGSKFNRSGDSASYVWLPNRSIATAFPSSGVVMFDSSNRWGYRTSTFKTVSFSTSRITANTMVIDSFPDYSGTYVMKYQADTIFNKILNGVKLGSLTSNGLVKTSGGDGTLSIATSGTDYTLLNGTGLVSMSGTTASYNTTSAQIAGIISDETGRGTNGVMMFNENPSISLSLTVPSIYGGSLVNSSLTFISTSGVGTTGADIFFKTGSNGSTTVAQFTNGGNVNIGGVPNTSVNFPLYVQRNQASTTSLKVENTSGANGAYAQGVFTSSAGSVNVGVVGSGTSNSGSYLTASAYNIADASGGYSWGTSSSTDVRIITANTERIRVSSAGNTYIGSGTAATSTLQTLSFGPGYVEKTANYTATINDFTINVTANSPTITLPTATGIASRIYVVANSGAGTVTITGTGGQSVAVTSRTGGQSVILQSTGSAWIALASKE